MLYSMVSRMVCVSTLLRLLWVIAYFSGHLQKWYRKAIAFASLKLTSILGYTIEAEAFAVIWSFTEVPYNLTLGSHIVVYSDHNPLTYITEGLTKSSKLMRWSLALQEFDIEFKCAPGVQNVVADCLLRFCDGD